MKLKDFIRKYYKMNEKLDLGSEVIRYMYKEMILPGTFNNFFEFKKYLSWNLDREVYFREVTKDNVNSNLLYITLTTGKLDLYVTMNSENEFMDYIENGLKKHRQYRKDLIPHTQDGRVYLFYSRKYE